MRTKPHREAPIPSIIFRTRHRWPLAASRSSFPASGKGQADLRVSSPGRWLLPLFQIVRASTSPSPLSSPLFRGSTASESIHQCYNKVEIEGRIVKGGFRQAGSNDMACGGNSQNFGEHPGGRKRALRSRDSLSAKGSSGNGESVSRRQGQDRFLLLKRMILVWRIQTFGND